MSKLNQNRSTRSALRNQAIGVALLIGALATISACNFKYEKAGAEDVEGLGQQGIPGYAEVNAAIFQPKCMNCHATQLPVLGSYEAVVAEIKDIESTVLVKHTMPRNRPLEGNLQRMLRAWIAAGTPRVGESTEPVPEPSAKPVYTGGIPRPYTFAYLKASVLEPKCNTCHATGNQDGITPLDTYAGVESVKEWILPLVLGVSGKETVPVENRMPPEKSPPLTDEDKALLLLWFADGALDAAPDPEPSPIPNPAPTPSPTPIGVSS